MYSSDEEEEKKRKHLPGEDPSKVATYSAEANAKRKAEAAKPKPTTGAAPSPNRALSGLNTKSTPWYEVQKPHQETVDVSRMTQEEAYSFALRITTDAERDSFLKDWSKAAKKTGAAVPTIGEMRTGVERLSDVGVYADTKKARTKQITKDFELGYANSKNMGALAKFGLFDVNGNDIDVNTASPQMIVQGIQGIGDTAKRKEAAKVFQTLMETKGSRFYGFTTDADLTAYRDSAEMTLTDYNSIVDGYKISFYAGEGHEQENAEAYRLQYEGIQREENPYTRRLLTEALDKAYRDTTYAESAPDMHTPEAEQAAEAVDNAEALEEKGGLIDRIGSWVGGLFSGEEKAEEDPGMAAGEAEREEPQPEQTAAEAEREEPEQTEPVAEIAAPTSAQTAQEGGRWYEKAPGWQKGQEPAEAPAEAQTAQPVEAQGTGGRWFENAPGWQEGQKTEQEPVYVATQDAGDVVALMKQGKGALIDPNDPNKAYVDELYQDANVRKLNGVLSDEANARVKANNVGAEYEQTLSLGSFGTTIQLAYQTIHGADFPQELYGDCMMILNEVVRDAGKAIERGEIATDPTAENAFEAYLKANPEQMAKVQSIEEARNALIANQNELRTEQQQKTEQAIKDARTAILNGNASDEQWALWRENISVDAGRVDDTMFDSALFADVTSFGGEYWSSGAYAASSLKGLLNASGITDDTDFRLSLRGEMNVILQEDAEMAVSLGMTVDQYHQFIGGMSADQLANRAYLRMQEQGASITPEEQEVLSGGAGVGALQTVGYGTARGAQSLVGKYADSLYMGLTLADVERQGAENRNYYQREFGAYGADYYRRDLMKMIDSGELSEAFASSLKQAMNEARDIYDVGIDPTAHGILRSTASQMRSNVQELDVHMTENATPGEYKWYQRVGSMTENAGMAAVAAVGTLATGIQGIGFSLGYSVPGWGQNLEARLNEGYSLTSASHMASLDTAASHLANSGTFSKVFGQMTGATTLERAGWFNAMWKNPSGASKALAAVAKFTGTAAGNIWDEAVTDEFKENIAAQTVDAVFGPFYRKIDAGESMGAGDVIAVLADAPKNISVTGAAKDVAANFTEVAITTSLFALAGASGKTYDSVIKAKEITSGQSSDVQGFVDAVAEDAQNPEFVQAINADAKAQQIEERTVEVLVQDDGSDGKMAAAQKTQEQADSHKAEADASMARMENAKKTYYERKEAGDIDAANAALMDFAKARQGYTEHTREAEQKSYEAQQIREGKMQDARRQATMEVAQEAAGMREAAAAQADVIRYESMTGDDSIRQDRLSENMRSKGYANQREDFAEAIDTWDGKQKGLSFVLGRTSQPLASLGVPDADIVIQSDKLEKIKKKHPAMSNEVIKQIPEVVENPIVVMESGTVKDRLTMFGSVMDDAGDPVLAVVAMSPKTNVVTGVNFLEVNSAYGKNTDPQGFIDRSNVLYVDKKRAAEWEVSTRLQLPVEPSHSGSSSTSILARGTENVKRNREIQGDIQEDVQGAPYTGMDYDTIEPTKTSGKAKKNPVQIYRRLAKSLGVGQVFGTRKMNGNERSLAGYYQPRTNYAATGTLYASSIEVMAHELGHSIANRLGITGTPEMVQNLSARFVMGYAANELPGEAFAEFFWRYMISDEAGRDFAGDAFVSDLERRMRQEGLLKAVRRAQRETRQYLNAEADERIQLMIRDKSDKKKDRTAGEWIDEAERRFVTEMVDSTRPAEDVNAAVRKATGKVHIQERMNLRNAALMQSTAPRRAWNLLTGSLTDVNGTIIGDSLKTRLERSGIKGKEFDLLNEYMLAKHSLDRDMMRKPVFDRQAITVADTEDFIRKTERAHPAVARAAQEFQKFRHDFMMAYMVRTGYMTEDTLFIFEALYPDYVPTYRVKERGRRGAGGQTYEIRRASGSTEEIINPMDSFVEMVNTIVAMNLRNETAKTWDRVYRSYEGMGIFGREAAEDTRTTIMDMRSTQASVREILENGSDVDEDVIQRVLNTIGEEQIRRSGTGGVNLPNVLTVQLPDGNKRYYEMFDTELFDMIAGTQDSGKSIFGVFTYLTRGMSALTTGSNPLFGSRNFLRDFQSSVNYGSWASNYVSGLGKWITSAFDVWLEKGDYAQYKALGGGGWTQINPESKKGAEEYRGELFKGYNTSNIGRTAKWAGRKIWNGVTLARLNEIIEQTSRYAEYKYGQHDTTTAEGRQEAYLAAQDVTTDFTRSGSSRVARELRAFVPFFNASLQGIYRTGRQATQAESDRSGTRFIKTVINTGVASAIASGFLLKCLDDDEKEEFYWLSDDMKAKHLYIPNFAPGVFGDVPLIRIPLAQDPLSYAVHAAVTNAMWTGEGEEWAIGLCAIADNLLNSINPISSTTLDPIIAMSTNKNWYGSNIVPRSMEGWYPTTQYTEETPEMFIAFSRGLDKIGQAVSPMMLQYVAEQYTGYIGQMVIPYFSKDKYTGEIEGVSAVIEDVRKTLTSDPLISSGIVSTVYDNTEFLTSVTKAYQNDRQMDMLRDGLTETQRKRAYDEAYAMTHSGGALYEAKKAVTNGYAEIEEIEGNQSLTDEQKYELTSRVRRNMIETALDANEEMEAYRQTYVTGTDFISRWVDNLTRK